MNYSLGFHGIKGMYKPISPKMKEKRFVLMMKTPSVLSVTVSATLTILMASALELNAIVPMIIDGASIKH